ncbi:unnamed protein product [Alopecurus aequalis]
MSASSDPSPSSSAAASPLGLLRAHHPHPHHLHLSTPPPVALAHAYPPAAPPPSPASAPRDYRKGNWTLHETLILITAKRLDDDRRAGGAAPGPSSPLTPRSAEQRWKWVENYCWINGCLRSQNQCNDKWDNLLRDYKKVRDHECRRASLSAQPATAALPDAPGAGVAHPPPPQQQQLPSYWTMERHDRKERNLPTNLAPEVYDALVDVLSRRAARRGGNAIAPTATAPPMLALPPPPPPPGPPPPPPPSPPKPQPQPQPLLAQQQQQQHLHPPPLLQLPPGLPLPPASSVYAEEDMTGSSESGSDGDDGDAADEPEAKRRRRVERLGSSVVRSATVLARTLVACEDKRERRHREVLELEERRLRLEAERNEVRRQGFAGLVAAVNGLSGAIHALVSSDHHRSGDSSRR